MGASIASRAMAVLCAVLATASLHAQTYPSKPIRFLVGFPPGGANDIVTRLLAQKLSETMGQTFIVENRGGANTAIATEMMARAAPDGYTILLNAAGHATNPALMKLSFDSVKTRLDRQQELSFSEAGTGRATTNPAASRQTRSTP